MRVNGREWPPDPVMPSVEQKKSPPESWLVIFLIPGAPLIAWILGALLVWPIGWLVALIITLISVYARERHTK